MRHDRNADNDNVISLPERTEGRIATRPTARQPAAQPPLPRDALGDALDALLIAQFELCGHDPHPTRASLSETRFRQAREALDAGIAVLRRLAEGADLPVPIDLPTGPNEDDVYAAD